MNSYVQNIIENPARQLPPDVPFSTWFRRHQAELESNPYLRELNGVIAFHLLPLFEKDIYAWQAVRFLNTWDVESDRDLTQFFLHWFCAVPSEIGFCVNRIAKSFGVSKDFTSLARKT